jgi:hypothetical protein
MIRSVRRRPEPEDARDPRWLHFKQGLAPRRLSIADMFCESTLTI